MVDGIAAVVILYNPSILVYEKIESYIGQVDILYAFDNSEKKNLVLINKLKENSKVKYFDNETNKGIAEVLNNAANKAINSGYKFLLTMDQDSKAPKDLVRTLYNKAIESDKFGIISPLHSNKFNTHLKPIKNNVERVMSVMTSGNLLSLKVFKKIGQFSEDFFIDYVDIEYCIRMNFNNYSVLRINSVVLEHDEGNLTKKKFLSKIFYPSNNPPTRYYYKTRNLLYLRNFYRKKFQNPLKIEYNSYIRNVAKMFLFEKQRLQKTQMIILGVWDYIKGKKGKRF